MTQGLPGGRGPKLGPDGKQVQDEAYDARQHLNPRADGWLVTNDDIYDDAVLDVPVAATGTVYLSWVRTQGFQVLGLIAELTKARVTVYASSASQFLYTGLYSFDDSSGEIALVSGSKAAFSTTSTGLIENPVSCTLSSEGRYLLGVIATSTIPTFRGMATASASRLLPGYTFADTDLTKRFQLSKATKNYTMSTISVAYLSAQAARYL